MFGPFRGRSSGVIFPMFCLLYLFTSAMNWVCGLLVSLPVIPLIVSAGSEITCPFGGSVRAYFTQLGLSIFLSQDVFLLGFFRIGALY